jgi:hypothetical protein
MRTIAGALQVSHSGFHSAAKFWPDVFAGHGDLQRAQVLKALARVRSVLIKGYETMVMVGALSHGACMLLVVAG